MIAFHAIRDWWVGSVRRCVRFARFGIDRFLGAPYRTHFCYRPRARFRDSTKPFLISTNHEANVSPTPSDETLDLHA
jgi:hypothetical protein